MGSSEHSVLAVATKTPFALRQLRPSSAGHTNSYEEERALSNNITEPGFGKKSVLITQGLHVLHLVGLDNLNRRVSNLFWRVLYNNQQKQTNDHTHYARRPHTYKTFT